MEGEVQDSLEIWRPSLNATKNQTDSTHAGVLQYSECSQQEIVMA